MVSWKKAINTSLSRLTGYHLTRTPRPGDTEPRRSATLAGTAKRLDTVAAELQKAVPPSTPHSAAPKRAFPDDFDEDFRAIITAVRPYTMTGSDKLHALISATKYIHDHAIPGDVVECGVWRGGSMHAVARVLDAAGDHSRDLYLFDTFEGMPPPTARDRRLDGRSAAKLLAASEKSANVWAYATLEDVRAGFETVPYPAERIHYVQGKVEDTVPERAPAQISLLRLDTDWYESTRHELEHLYGRLVSGGVLIIDDYGWWQGSRDATEEFLRRTDERLLLVRAGSGRIAVKP
ncbi:MAG: TylF/MycF/NovP-related O-methyltransferase [Jiangellaceae bacterium]